MNPQAPLDKLEMRQYSGSELSDRVVGGYVDGTGKIYFVADINVKYYNRDSARFDNLQLNGIPQYYATTCILVDRRGSIWFGKHNGGLYRYDPDQDDAEMYDLIKAGLTSNWVSTLFEDKEGNIWAGTWGGGMVRISPENKLDLFNNRNGLPGMKIRTIMQDREDNILVGTHENGLCVYKGDHFISYFMEDGLINSQVWSIQQTDDGDLWFGTNEGISILERKSGSEKFTEFHKLKGGRIGFLKEDKNGTMWIGSLDRVYSAMKRTVGSVFDPLINNNIELYQVNAMDVDGDNNLWVGTLEGLIYFEIDTGKVNRLSQVNGLKGNDISSIFADSKNHIWVGSAGKGITVIKGSNFEQLDLGFDFTPRCFAEDLDGNIWIGTEGQGINTI